MIALALLLILLGAALGFGGGLFGPVLVLKVVGYGSGSYEDVLPIWLLTLPGGMFLGGWVGFRVYEHLRTRRFRVDDPSAP